MWRTIVQDMDQQKENDQESVRDNTGQLCRLDFGNQGWIKMPGGVRCPHTYRQHQTRLALVRAKFQSAHQNIEGYPRVC